MIEKRRKKSSLSRTGSKRKKLASLTKRTLIRAVNKGAHGLTEKEMELLGYVTRIENGWVVRTDKDGNTTKIAKVDIKPLPDKIVLD